MIAIDLHKMTELGSSVYYLHIIDVFTKFSEAGFLFNKKPESVTGVLMKKRCLRYGYPKKVFADNGGVFQLEVDICDRKR